jgi:hypothetical protein
VVAHVVGKQVERDGELVDAGPVRGDAGDDLARSTAVSTCPR